MEAKLLEVEKIDAVETFDLIKVSDLENPFPVSAKKLHQALNVGTEFSHWFRRRVTTYELIVDQDYAEVVTSNVDENILIKQYFLTLASAKELAMVENNETGRKVRRYFIEMERRAKGFSGLYSVPNFAAQENAAAAVIIESQLKIGLLLGAPQSLTRAHAVTEVSKLFPKINLRPLLVDNPEEKQELDLIPTEIAKEIGLKTAAQANLLLVTKGLQAKNNGTWELTEMGRSYGAYHRTAKAHSNGTPVQQIKWKKDVLKVLVD